MCARHSDHDSRSDSSTACEFESPSEHGCLISCFWRDRVMSGGCDHDMMAALVCSVVAPTFIPQHDCIYT